MTLHWPIRLGPDHQLAARLSALETVATQIRCADAAAGRTAPFVTPLRHTTLSERLIAVRRPAPRLRESVLATRLAVLEGHAIRLPSGVTRPRGRTSLLVLVKSPAGTVQ